MATMIFESMEKHALYMRRVDLNVALHLNYLEERKAEYMRVKWTRDNWDEELTTYCKKGEELPEEVCKFVEHVHVNGKNAGLIAAFLKDYEYYARNNLKQYLRRGDK